ncbi:hypothetical protein HMPREF0577_1979, partial [Mobiluncus mulieris ATCC 35243]
LNHQRGSITPKLRHVSFPYRHSSQSLQPSKTRQTKCQQNKDNPTHLDSGLVLGRRAGGGFPGAFLACWRERRVGVGWF